MFPGIYTALVASNRFSGVLGRMSAGGQKTSTSDTNQTNQLTDKLTGHSQPGELLLAGPRVHVCMSGGPEVNPATTLDT